MRKTPRLGQSHPLDGNVGAAVTVSKWYHGPHGRALHTRQRAHVVEQLLPEIPDRRILRVLLGAQIQFHGQHAFGDGSRDSTSISRCKLFSINPALTRRISARDISAMASAPRKRFCAAPALVVRPPSFSSACTSVFIECAAGANPNTNAVSATAAAANSKHGAAEMHAFVPSAFPWEAAGSSPASRPSPGPFPESLRGTPTPGSRSAFAG